MPGSARLFFLGVTTQCFGQGTVRITFDGEPTQPRGTASYVQQYFEGNMWFRPLGVVGPGNGFVRRGGGGLSFYPENGTAYVQTTLGDSLTFSPLNEWVFDLTSVDLAEYSTVVSDAVTVPFVGYRQDGSVVTTSFTTDGIIDGTGPLADFQTFSFGPEFHDLTRVEIPTYAWSLDNLMVTYSVPEPTGTTLLFAGGLLMYALRRQRPYRGRSLLLTPIRRGDRSSGPFGDAKSISGFPALLALKMFHDRSHRRPSYQA